MARDAAALAAWLRAEAKVRETVKRRDIASEALRQLESLCWNVAAVAERACQPVDPEDVESIASAINSYPVAFRRQLMALIAAKLPEILVEPGAGRHCSFCSAGST